MISKILTWKKGIEGITKIDDESDYHLFNQMVDILTPEKNDKKKPNMLGGLFKTKSLRN